MKILLGLIFVLVALVAVIAVVGALLPRAHTATRAATYRKPPAELHALLRDVAAAPAWRSDVKSVEVLPPRDGRDYYRETTRHGTVTYRVLEDRPGELRVTEIADLDLPYGGTWTFELAPVPGGGRLRITERGEVKNVVFRFLARFVFGHTATIETYLRDLGRRLGEETTPQP